jgi:hypothetical protein
MSASITVVSMRSLRHRSSLSSTSLPSSALLSCSTVCAPLRRTSLISVVGCGTGEASGMRQNRRHLSE